MSNYCKIDPPPSPLTLTKPSLPSVNSMYTVLTLIHWPHSLSSLPLPLPLTIFYPAIIQYTVIVLTHTRCQTAEIDVFNPCYRWAIGLTLLQDIEAVCTMWHNLMGEVRPIKLKEAHLKNMLQQVTACNLHLKMMSGWSGVEQLCTAGWPARYLPTFIHSTTNTYSTSSIRQ